MWGRVREEQEGGAGESGSGEKRREQVGHGWRRASVVGARADRGGVEPRAGGGTLSGRVQGICTGRPGPGW